MGVKKGKKKSGKVKRDSKIPMIDHVSQLASISGIDSNIDIIELHPLYQKGKLVAYRKQIWVAPKDSGANWGDQGYIKPEERVIEYFPE